MKRWIFALSAPLALSAQPLAAQNEKADEDNEAFAALAEMFAAEPLTAEQEARLPLAREVITNIMPEGAMSEMMGSMFDGMLKPLMEMEMTPSEETLAKELGNTPIRDMTQEEIAEASLMLDPVRAERKARMAEMMPSLMTRMMDAMEPIMREAMIEVYAANFTMEELTGINAFFQTETGAAYARKSLSLQQDPRLIGAVMQSMPVIMDSMKDMVAQVEQAMADLPPEKKYTDLSPEERARLQALTGLDQESLESGLEFAARQREEQKKSLETF